MKPKLSHILAPGIVAIVVSIALYTVGNAFEIPWLRFYYEQTVSTAGGFELETGGSMIPLLIGIASGFVVERLLKKRAMN